MNKQTITAITALTYRLRMETINDIVGDLCNFDENMTRRSCLENLKLAQAISKKSDGEGERHIVNAKKELGIK